ncbi:DUF559 domain-containing protein [Legionella bononiensis]|uniref:DUF559 domain-containing protein n=1 Tax=Legionella bononiensis TaxID=2793102 RepID=A0ABS1WFW9_9GAMM|nr:DUF559 domain-containing protein [Legionella bononiensis]MBL7528248.1 DUF559 domain-containing protein [Legionella bononiensis]MBL7562723.1 DUF559 domain-containing protein [Legionella bononiensis]
MEQSTLRQRARDLRKNSTNVKQNLWYRMRANRLVMQFIKPVPVQRLFLNKHHQNV